MEKYVMDVRALIISVEIVLCISKKKIILKPFRYNRQWQTESNLHKMTQASSSFQVSQRFKNSNIKYFQPQDARVLQLQNLWWWIMILSTFALQKLLAGIQLAYNSSQMALKNKQELERNQLKN